MNRLLTPRWLLTSLIVLAGVGVCVRLGFWQLDRLEQRRVFNTRVQAQMQASSLNLNTAGEDLSLPDEEYRMAVASGEFDAGQSVLLRNQVREGQSGYHLLAPLVLSGTDRAVIVDLGWIPPENSTMDQRRQLVPGREVTVQGMLRKSQVKDSLWGVADPPLEPGQERLDAWNFVTINRLEQQMGYQLLPVFLQAAPEGKPAGPPYAMLPQFELTEGSHLGYALQWFAFAGILGIGYPFFVRRQLGKPAGRQQGERQ